MSEYPIVLYFLVFFHEKRYILFEKSYSQGNQWNEGFFEIEPVENDFQIVIEASGRIGYVINDIAIDDVALLKNMDCIKFIKPATETITITEESGGIFNIQSCANRCDETHSYRSKGNETFTKGQQITEKCDCHAGCLDLSTCCPDYKMQCLEGILFVELILIF